MQNVTPHILARCVTTAIALVAALGNLAFQSGPMVLCVESDGHVTIERVCGGTDDDGREAHIPFAPASYGDTNSPGHAPCTDISLGSGAVNKPQQSFDHERQQLKSLALSFAGNFDTSNVATATAVCHAAFAASISPDSRSGVVLLI
ncbi:MAG: hypothetical protein AAB353_12515 [Candidatus Hydrogenedentota bacterium]